MATNPAVGTFDPKKVIVTFGEVIMSGMAEGTFVNITRSGDGFEKRKGSDGSVDRINKNAFDCSVEVTLMQTSPINDLLSLIYIQDQASNTGVKPLTVKDLSGTTLFFAPLAWIRVDPADEMGDSLGNRTWAFDTGIATKFTGGNIL